MKGLMLKDGYLIFKTYKLYLPMCLIFLAAFIMGNNNSFMLAYPVLILGMIPMNLISMDEASGWDAFSAALPVSRAAIVSVRYLLTLILAAGISLFYLLILGGWALYTGESVSQVLMFLPAVISIMLLPPAAILPCVLKFGFSKGSVLYFIFIGLVFGVIMVAANTLFDVSSSIFGFITKLMIALPLISIALFGLSWLLSVRIYKKKEF